MALTLEQKQLIIYIDQKVNEILLEGGDNTALIIGLADIRDDLKKIIDSSIKNELKLYYWQYDGFYCYMKLLEELSYEVSKERSSVPKYVYN